MSSTKRKTHSEQTNLVTNLSKKAKIADLKKKIAKPLLVSKNMSTTTKKTPSEQTILVTGASGFIAGHVLESFLSKGYNVRGTVRSESRAEQVRKFFHSTTYSENNQLSFAIVPDMSVPGAFDEAVKGVDGVIHTASPFTFQVTDVEKELLIPAINGATHLVKAVAEHAPNVKRVVLTSSFAAIVDLNKGLRPGYIYSEDDWNPCTYDEAKKMGDGAVAYCASKALAEHAAFDWVKEHQSGFDLVAICPPMVYGPIHHSVKDDMEKLNMSSADIYRFLNGSTTEVGTTSFPLFCDVRDVAEAHLRAYETAAAVGGKRFAVTGGNFFYQDVCTILRAEFPELQENIPDPTQGEYPPAPYALSNERAKSFLGMTFRPFKETIIDTAKSLLALEKDLVLVVA